jgi:hypothetical protein
MFPPNSSFLPTYPGGYSGGGTTGAGMLYLTFPHWGTQVMRYR